MGRLRELQRYTRAIDGEQSKEQPRITTQTFRTPKSGDGERAPRHSGEPTGKRIRRLLTGVTNMSDARAAEAEITRQWEQKTAVLFTDFLQNEYLEWARVNKARPDIDERYARDACASQCFKGRNLDEISVIQAEATSVSSSVPRTDGAWFAAPLTLTAG